MVDVSSSKDLLQLDEQARPWLLLLDALEKLDIHEELPIPQIAVFGDQSSGKSSLLESLSGVIFPKGSGLVTRCPTRISMTRCLDGSPWTADVSISGDIAPGTDVKFVEGSFKSPVELSAKLIEAADMICGPSSNGFSTTSINVAIRSPSTPNLTLVDLPGIVRTTTNGQNKSVISAVDNLLEYFLRQPETVILAVIPANQDIATVDILERASKVDPTGSRTIGVLTKPDLIDEGSENEVLSIINNNRKPLKLGYVMVKNRNQGELNSAVSISEGIRAEQLYFHSHAVWSKLDCKSVGMQALSSKLTSIIISRAVDRAPVIKWHLLDSLSKLDERLTSLGAELPSSDEEKRKVLMRVISRFSQTLRQISAGDYRDPLTRSDTDLRIKYHVGEILQRLRVDLSRNIPDVDNDEYSRRLAATICSMRGRYE
jgi:interferon-induced GTP-binding protein Mx1